MMICLENMQAFEISKKRTVVFLIVSFVASVIATVILRVVGFDIEQNIWLFYVYIGLLMSVVNTFQYKSLVKGIVCGVFGILYIFGVDGLTTLFFLLLGRNYDSPYWSIVFMVHALGITSTIFILRRIFKKRIDMNVFNNKSTYLVTAISGVMIILAYIVFRGDELYAPGAIMYALAFVSIVVMFIVIMRYVFHDTARRTEMLIAEASKQYTRDLEESYAALRAIRHDYVNIMTSFKLYIDDRDIDGLAKYYYNELSEMNRELSHQNKLITSLQNIHINEIKSILVYKASTQYVTTTIEAPDPIRALGVSTAIVCQILGILMDNAIEAAMDTQEKHLSIAIFSNPTAKVFIIKNSWQQQELEIGKLFELGFSTKGSNRGVGLYTVRNYTNKIKGLLLKTELAPDSFTQILTVKDDI